MASSTFRVWWCVQHGGKAESVAVEAAPCPMSRAILSRAAPSLLRGGFPEQASFRFAVFHQFERLHESHAAHRSPMSACFACNPSSLARKYFSNHIRGSPANSLPQSVRWWLWPLRLVTGLPPNVAMFASLEGCRRFPA